MRHDIRKYWAVEHPITAYVEDVKLLAMRANLRIIDARFINEFNPDMIETDVATLPKLTKKGAPVKSETKTKE